MRFYLLDIFRGLAAIWVLLHHYPYSSNLAESAPLLQNFVKNGHLGVCLFFVISGYCITASACKSIQVAESPNRFLDRRLFRILPPFWCSILVGVSIPFLLSTLSLLKTGVWLSPDFSKVAHANFSWVDWLHIATLTRGFAWSQDSTLFGRWAGFNTPYWSLAIEAQFYLVVFLALKSKWNIRYFISIVTVASLISLAVPDFDQSGFFLPYWPTFGLGCILFLIPKANEGWQSFFKWLSLLAGIGCIFLSLSPTEFALQFKNLLMGAGFSIFLYPFHHVSVKKNEEPKARNTLTASWMAVASILGAASYSIYLMHTKLLLISIAFTRDISLPDWFRDLFGILVTLMGCLVCYFLFEKPFLRMSIRRKPEPYREV